VPGSSRPKLTPLNNSKIQSSVIGLIDQGLTGARQFLILLIAASFLPRNSFAELAKMSASAPLVLQLSNYCIRLPMLSLAGGVFAQSAGHYLALVRWVDLGVSILVSIIVGLAVVQPSNSEQMTWLALFVVMGACGGLLEMNRRICYITQRITIACIGSALSLCSAIIALEVAQHFRALNLSLVLAIQCVSMMLGAVASWRGRLLPYPASPVTIGAFLTAHRAYAGWEMGAGTILWSCTNGLIVFGSSLLTAGQTGAFRLLTSLCQIVVLPLNVAEMSLSTKAAGVFAAEGRAGLGRWLLALDNRFKLLFVPYVALAGLSTWLFSMFFLRRKYPETESMFPVFLIFTVLTILPTTRNITLRAMRLSSRVFQSEVTRGAVCLVICLLAVRMHSATVLTSALAFGTLAFAVSQFLIVRKEVFRGPVDAASDSVPSVVSPGDGLFQAASD
jgi:hypothetical protein